MTQDEATAYLLERATNEGITFDNLMNMIPDAVSDDAIQAAEFCQLRDYSHIVAVSEAPGLATDPNNAFFEHPSPNRARGADEALDCEIDHAELDGDILAEHIDADTVDAYIYEPHDCNQGCFIDLFGIPIFA